VGSARLAPRLHPGRRLDHLLCRLQPTDRGVHQPDADPRRGFYPAATYLECNSSSGDGAASAPDARPRRDPAHQPDGTVIACPVTSILATKSNGAPTRV